MMSGVSHIFSRGVSARCLDKYNGCGIVRLTSKMHGGVDVFKNRQQTVQGRSASGGGELESHTRKGRRSEVPGLRVLRSPRHCPSQVRDVAPRFGGKHSGDEGRRTVRRVPAHVLSSQGRLRRSGDRRAGPEEAGSSPPSQTSAGGLSLSREPDRSGRTDPSAQAGRLGSAGVRSRGASPVDRASAPSKKNATVKLATRDNGPPSTITDQYETLRGVAWGGRLPPEARSGLGLFLRRGMWAWARALGMPGEPVPPKRSPLGSGATSARDQSRAVVQVFAAMALNTHRNPYPRREP